MALYGEKVEFPEVARAYAENNGPMVDWLDKGLNVDFGQREGTYGIYENVGSCNPSTAEGHGLDIALEVGVCRIPTSPG